MRAVVLALAVLLAACGDAPRTSDEVDTMVRVTLPEEPASSWAGAGGALIARNCTACHSPEMIANQPPLGAEKWQATIDKMRDVYQARIDPADDRALIAALGAAQAPRNQPPE